MVMRDPKGGFHIPNVRMEKTDKALVSRAGLHGLLQIFDTTDLGKEFAKCLPEDGSNRAYGAYQLGLLWIACLLSGFDSIDDIEEFDDDDLILALFGGKLPTAKTMGNFLRRFEPQHIRALNHFLTKMGYTLRDHSQKVHPHKGESLPHFKIDGTVHEQHGKQMEGCGWIKMSDAKSVYGYASQTIFDEMGFCYAGELCEAAHPKGNAAALLDQVLSPLRVFDRNTHNNIGGTSTSNRFFAGGPVTIQNSHFEGGGSDGVRLATSAKVNVIYNTFLNILDDGSGNHTDMIQWYGGSNAVVRGNLFKQTISGETQVMGAFDGTGGNLIEDNVVDVTGRNWGVELYADSGSIVRHNTLVYRSACPYNLPCGFIDLDHKSSDPAGMNTEVYDNIATAVLLESGSTASRRDHNMVYQSAGSGDFIGIPVFVGGANPSTYEGYALAPGSPGKGKASDGLDVGIRINP